jgi:serine/threonine-protein kinase
MAAVYEALNIDIGKRVAVKVLAAELITSRVVRERFIREARAASAIRSPHICDVYDSGMFDERPFLVMELLEGESLYDMMTRVRRLDVPTTLRIMTQTCRGLTKAHEASVIHRDLKPENIFLTTNEDGEMISKILDFGLAKFYEPTGGDAAQARLTREGALFGTPAYMSPEQAKGQGEVDHRADLWALGCIAYECLTGQTVWNVDQGVAMILAQIAGSPLPRPSKLRPDIPRTFDPWFAKALDRNIENRFQTAKEFAESITEALQPGRPPSFARNPVPAPPPEPLITGEEATAPISMPVGSGPLGSGPVQLTSSPGTQSNPYATGGFAGGPVQPGGYPVAPDLVSGEGLGRAASGNNTARAITALLIVGALVFGAYGFWFYVLNPPLPAAANSIGATPEEPVDPAASSDKSAVPLERGPLAKPISAGQEALAAGRTADAVRFFREAFQSGGTGLARNLFTLAQMAAESKDPCAVTGLGRPRPFDLEGNSSEPTVAYTKSGPVVAWVDNHLDPAKYQGYTVLLDSALRRVSMTHSITPEARATRGLDLVTGPEALAVVYADRGAEPGVYVRPLERDGRIAGSARRVSNATGDQQVDSALARAEDGSYWAVWSQSVDDGIRELFARHLDSEFSPAGDPVRLTWVKRGGRGLVGATAPHAAIVSGHLYVAYSMERGAEAQVALMRMSFEDPILKGEAQDAAARDKGNAQYLSPTRGKNVDARITCLDTGCIVVWDQERGGAFAAYVTADKGEKLWHRELDSKGSRPNVTRNAKGDRGAIAWYDSGRLKLASIDRDGVGAASVVAKVSGFQPPASLVAGEAPGTWYVAWRDYEAGHLEAFVLRAQCR